MHAYINGTETSYIDTVSMSSKTSSSPARRSRRSSAFCCITRANADEELFRGVTKMGNAKRRKRIWVWRGLEALAHTTRLPTVIESYTRISDITAKQTFAQSTNSIFFDATNIIFFDIIANSAQSAKPNAPAACCGGGRRTSSRGIARAPSSASSSASGCCCCCRAFEVDHQLDVVEVDVFSHRHRCRGSRS